MPESTALESTPVHERTVLESIAPESTAPEGIRGHSSTAVGVPLETATHDTVMFCSLRNGVFVIHDHGSFLLFFSKRIISKRVFHYRCNVL